MIQWWAMVALVLLIGGAALFVILGALWTSAWSKGYAAGREDVLEEQAFARERHG